MCAGFLRSSVEVSVFVFDKAPGLFPFYGFFVSQLTEVSITHVKKPIKWAFLVKFSSLTIIKLKRCESEMRNLSCFESYFCDLNQAFRKVWM